MTNLLKQKREELGISQAKLGKMIGVSQQHIQRFEKGTPVPLKHILPLSKALNVDPASLFPKEFKNIDFTAQPNQNNVSIEMIDAAACCGDGLENFVENVIGFWQMPKEEYRAISTIAPEHIKMLRVFGDSMETTLSDGDWVLVDITRNFFDSDGIFLIRLSTGLSVKRIQGTLGTDVVICSDNPKYKPITAAAREVFIVGKVIYTLKAEKVG